MSSRLSSRQRLASIAALAGIVLTTPARGQCVPEIVGTACTSQAGDVAISGTHAYVADGASGLRVIDVSDPAHPTIVGSVDIADARGVAVSGPVAYVAAAFDGLLVVDVSVPASPQIIGSVDPPNFASWDVAVSGNFAYLVGLFGFDSGQMHVIDVSDPEQPIIVGTYKRDLGWYSDVAVSGPLVCATDPGAGLDVIDVSVPEQPTRTATLGEFVVGGVDISGDLVYLTVTDYPIEGQVWVIDVSDPKIPTIIGSVRIPGSGVGSNVAVAGGEAYVTNYTAGLQIVDVSIPSNPTLLGHVATPASALAVAVSGGVTYVGAGEFHVVDTSTCDRGACCLTEGCLELTSATCASVSGTYLGDASTCATGLCPLPCPADLNDNGAVDFADILALLTNWGPCP